MWTFIKTSVFRPNVRYALYRREVLITVSAHTDKFDYELLKNICFVFTADCQPVSEAGGV